MAPAPYPTQPNSNYFHPPNPPNPSVPPFYHTPGPYDQKWSCFLKFRKIGINFFAFDI